MSLRLSWPLALDETGRPSTLVWIRSGKLRREYRLCSCRWRSLASVEFRGGLAVLKLLLFFSFLASPLSIIMDSELSDWELFYLRSLHHRHFYDRSSTNFIS